MQRRLRYASRNIGSRSTVSALALIGGGLTKPGSIESDEKREAAVSYYESNYTIRSHRKPRLTRRAVSFGLRCL
jgi:hypothetical protein